MDFGGDKDQSIKEISSVNPIADFNAMINDRKVDRVGDAIGQMQKIIERYITNSLKGDLFEKAMECFNELRTACIREDEAENFNAFAAHVK
jgi:ATP-dependent DNA helicase 2 subunit 2